jgi:signal transduction histidine kinase
MPIEENHHTRNIQAEIGELTRQIVVRQLHDGLTQTVSALAMRINYARRLITDDPQAAGEELEKVENLTRAATKEIRHIIFLLRPEGQEDFELNSELDSLAEKMGELFDIEISMAFNEDLVIQLPGDVQNVIFRIVEEMIDSARLLNEQMLEISLSLAQSDLAQLNLEAGKESDFMVNAFQEMDLNNIQSYASLIGGSVILGKDNNLVQVLFPVMKMKGLGMLSSE